MRYDPEFSDKPKQVRVVWTPKEDDVLRHAKENGISYAEVLDQLPGRSRSAVAGRYARMKIKALPYKERVEARKAVEALYPRKPRPPRAPRPSKQISEGDAELPPIRRSALSGYTIPRSAARAKMLPHLLMKNGTILAVYHKDPYVLTPMAVFERRSSVWVRRGDESSRFPSTAEAVRSMEPRW